MAYFAGNAYYITHTVKRIVSYVDYLNMCGAGVMIDDNLFQENIGLKKHNGGAAVHNCIYYDSASYLDKFGFTFTNSTSSQKLAISHYDEPTNKFIYDDHDMNDTLIDLYNSSKTY